MYLRYIFFSSRRRHTIYWRDWSSDVFSSDLILNVELARLRLMKIVQKQEDWNLFDFPRAEKFLAKFRDAQDLFSEALKIGRASCRERDRILDGRAVDYITLTHMIRTI